MAWLQASKTHQERLAPMLFFLCSVSHTDRMGQFQCQGELQLSPPRKGTLTSVGPRSFLDEGFGEGAQLCAELLPLTRQQFRALDTTR